ncbi:MBL fold metallo-hydrolase [Pseudomonadota bacterium]
MNQIKLGNVTIDRIVESENADIDPTYFFPDTTLADWAPHRAWLQPKAMDAQTGMLILPIQSYLIRTDHHTILIDCCVGDHKPRVREHWNMRSGGLFLKKLAELGVSPNQIDYVMCTHLHADHVGWNTQYVNGQWVPTFVNAKYVISKKEWNYWEELQKEQPQDHIVDSVLPVIENGQALLVDSDHSLDDQIWLESTPGHTPHHVSIRLKSNDIESVFTGDVMHSPVQCAEPHWSVRPDDDPELARKTRRAFLERYCDSNVLVCTAHFASPSIGHIIHHLDAFRFQYIKP